MERPRSVRVPPTGAPTTPSHPDPATPSGHLLETQLEGLQARFELLKAQVRQAQQLAGLGTAAAMIAHEVSNLLTPILSYAKVALASDNVQLQRKALDVTVQNVQMLIAMSDRVLEISAAKPAEREPVRLHNAIADALASLCRDLSKDGIRLSLKVGDSVTVRADALQIRQVFFNLFLNARQAMAREHSGSLTVSAEPTGNRVTVRVANTGTPIAPERLPHIFDPFESTKSANSNGRSRCSGLGLALCRDLVEENGGTIEVTSNSETGTVFTINLPRCDPSQEPRSA
jgi:signal transduction histidine kinase